MTLLDKVLSNLEIHVEPFSLCLLSSGWCLRLPGPPVAMLHFVLRGEGAVRGPDGVARPLAPCWLAVVPRGAKHSLEAGDEVRRERFIDAPAPRMVAGSSEEADLVVACGLVRVDYGESMGLFDHLRDVLAIDLSDRPEVRASFEGIMAEQAQPGAGSEAMTAALMSQCLVHLLRRASENPDCPLPWLTALDSPGLGRAIDHILERPGAPHTVDSLAEVASMSRSAFAQRFSRAFGLSPKSLVHHIRMQRAAHLLRQGEELSIDVVAQRVGFSSRSHFSRAFKKHYGLSPMAHRAQ